MKVLISEKEAEKLAEEIKKCADKSANEEELKIEIATLLHPVLKSWGVEPKYERYSGGSRCIASGRKDALYGTVILEYKALGKLAKKREFEKAKEQVKNYIKKESSDEKRYGEYFGVVLDGYQISFLRYRRGEWEEQNEPLEVNAHTIKNLNSASFRE